MRGAVQLTGVWSLKSGDADADADGQIRYLGKRGDDG
jgi:hypothetical protein